MRDAIKWIMIDRMRDKIPEQAANIEQFEFYMGSLQDLFRTVLEWSITADDRARKEVAGQLQGMETLSKMNDRLEAEKSDLIQKNDKLEKTIAEQTERIKKLEADLARGSYDADEIGRLKEKCASLTQEKADLIVKHNEEIATIQKENFAKILEIVKASTK